jgi:hypothetical protein
MIPIFQCDKKEENCFVPPVVKSREKAYNHYY